MGRQPGDPAQVKAGVAEHVQQDGVLSGGTGHGDAQVGLVLPEAEDPSAVLEHRRAGLVGIQPSQLHLADVSDDIGLDPSGLPHELGQLPEKVIIPDVLQAQHGDSLGEMTRDACRSCKTVTQRHGMRVT
jgi:hypothetical protein